EIGRSRRERTVEFLAARAAPDGKSVLHQIIRDQRTDIRLIVHNDKPSGVASLHERNLCLRVSPSVLRRVNASSGSVTRFRLTRNYRSTIFMKMELCQMGAR